MQPPLLLQKTRVTGEKQQKEQGKKLIEEKEGGLQKMFAQTYQKITLNINIQAKIGYLWNFSSFSLIMI